MSYRLYFHTLVLIFLPSMDSVIDMIMVYSVNNGAITW